MQFSSVLVAAAAFALANAASFTMTSSFFTAGLAAGSTANITWSGASGPVTLLLKNGPSTNLQTVLTIASGLTGTSYAWTVPASVANGQYAFEIDDSSGPNYSEEFALTGGSASASSSATTSGSSTSSGSSSSVTKTASTSSATSFSNSTSTSTSLTKTGPSATKASTTAASSSTSTSTPNSNSAASFASPLAFVFLALAAMMTIN